MYKNSPVGNKNFHFIPLILVLVEKKYEFTQYLHFKTFIFINTTTSNLILLTHVIYNTRGYSKMRANHIFNLARKKKLKTFLSPRKQHLCETKFT